jgi:hypothetical protein
MVSSPGFLIVPAALTTVRAAGLSKSVCQQFFGYAMSPSVFQMKGIEVCEVHQSSFISIGLGQEPRSRSSCQGSTKQLPHVCAYVQLRLRESSKGHYFDAATIVRWNTSPGGFSFRKLWIQYGTFL